jgi:hypothetical protein
MSYIFSGVRTQPYRPVVVGSEQHSHWLVRVGFAFVSTAQRRCPSSVAAFLSDDGKPLSANVTMISFCRSGALACTVTSTQPGRYVRPNDLPPSRLDDLPTRRDETSRQ